MRNTTRLASLAMIGMLVVLATACPPIVGDAAIPVTTELQVVTAGAHHTCAQNGKVFCWGDNSAGQLGDGTTTSNSTPVEVPGLTWVTGLSAGGNRTCAIASVDHHVVCWGDNSTGGLGDGTTIDRSSPTKVIGLYDVTTISVGDTFTCAARSGRYSATIGVVCWGQVPGVPGGYTTTPVPIPGLEYSTDVRVGGRHACALVGLSLECFGDNSAGQLGDGTTTSSATPVPVVGLPVVPPTSDPPTVLDFDAAGDHTCFVTVSVTSYFCWGDNSSGQLGDGTTTDRSTAQAIPFPALSIPVGTSVPTLALGDAFSCIEFDGPPRDDGFPPRDSVYGCWGDDSSGQLGDSHTDPRPTFKANVWDIAVGSITAGGTHACGFAGISSRPRVRCWGDNSAGQLGDGTTTSSGRPVEIPGAPVSFPAAPGPANTQPKVAFTASPKIPVAGQPVTFTYHITNLVGIISISNTVGGPGNPLPRVRGCGIDSGVWSGPDTDQTATVNCTWPAEAQGGLWYSSIDLRTVDAHPLHAVFNFSTTGGPNPDTTSPARVSTSISPSSIPVGGTVVFSARYSDPTGPVTVGSSYLQGLSCGAPAVDGSLAPIWTVSVACVGTNPSASAGLYLEVFDGVGNSTSTQLNVTVT